MEDGSGSSGSSSSSDSDSGSESDDDGDNDNDAISEEGGKKVKSKARSTSVKAEYVDVGSSLPFPFQKDRTRAPPAGFVEVNLKKSLKATRALFGDNELRYAGWSVAEVMKGKEVWLIEIPADMGLESLHGKELRLDHLPALDDADQQGTGEVVDGERGDRGVAEVKLKPVHQRGGMGQTVAVLGDASEQKLVAVEVQRHVQVFEDADAVVKRAQQRAEKEGLRPALQVRGGMHEDDEYQLGTVNGHTIFTAGAREQLVQEGRLHASSEGRRA